MKFANEFSAGSPEIHLLEGRAEKVYTHLITDHGVDEALLELEGATDSEKAEKAKSATANKVEWAGGFPVLAGLDIWRKPAGEEF